MAMSPLKTEDSLKKCFLLKVGKMDKLEFKVKIGSVQLPGNVIGQPQNKHYQKAFDV